MTEYDRMADCLDPSLLLKQIGDYRREEGKEDEALMWDLLAQKKRFPSPTHGKNPVKYRWSFSYTNQSASRLPTCVPYVKAQTSIRKAYEMAVEAMLKADRKSLLLAWSRLRGD